MFSFFDNRLIIVLEIHTILFGVYAGIIKENCTLFDSREIIEISTNLPTDMHFESSAELLPELHAEIRSELPAKLHAELIPSRRISKFTVQA